MPRAEVQCIANILEHGPPGIIDLDKPDTVSSPVFGSGFYDLLLFII